MGWGGVDGGRVSLRGSGIGLVITCASEEALEFGLDPNRDPKVTTPRRMGYGVLSPVDWSA